MESSVTPVDDAKRREWFGQFGCTGDLDATVTLRDNLGTATVADVWQVRRGMLALDHEESRGLFRRALLAITEGMRPVDHKRRLSLLENGGLTDEVTGEFLPGMTEIVHALIDINPDAIDGTWAACPLVRQEVRTAA